MRIYSHMNPVKYIRTHVFKLDQGPFARIAGVSQPTVSRWENSSLSGSEPNREQMDLIRCEAIGRGLEWDDGWFFQTFPDDAETTSEVGA